MVKQLRHGERLLGQLEMINNKYLATFSINILHILLYNNCLICAIYSFSFKCNNFFNPLSASVALI